MIDERRQAPDGAASSTGSHFRSHGPKLKSAPSWIGSPKMRRVLVAGDVAAPADRVYQVKRRSWN